MRVSLCSLRENKWKNILQIQAFIFVSCILRKEKKKNIKTFINENELEEYIVHVKCLTYKRKKYVLYTIRTIYTIYSIYSIYIVQIYITRNRYIIISQESQVFVKCCP